MRTMQIETQDSRSARMADVQRVLVVDDDPKICRLLTRFLSGEGFEVEAVGDGDSLWRKLQVWPCDLIVLDLRLPGGEDGLSIARRLREESDVALIMLSGRSDCVDKVVGLELGADDYVTKPFDLRELLARIRSALRRSGHVRFDHAAPGPPGRVVVFSGWTLDIDLRRLTSPAGDPVELTTYEFELLAMLACRPRRPLSRDQIAELIAHRERAPDDRSIDVMIGKLRRKLNDDPRAPRLIRTVRGVGYLFTPAASGD